MNYVDEKSRVVRDALLGTGLSVVPGTVSLIAFLKSCYVQADPSVAFAPGLALQIRAIVNAIYQTTGPYLLPVWQHAPLPNFSRALSSSNAGLLALYLATFGGVSLLRSAIRRFERPRRIRKQIEEELIRESIRGSNRRSREQIEESLQLPEQSKWKGALDKIFVQIVVGVIVWIIKKALGIS